MTEVNINTKDIQVLNIKTKKERKPLSRIEIPNTVTTWSEVIRFLHTKGGLDRSDIVRYFQQHLGRDIRYQHVRNVLITPPKKK